MLNERKKREESKVKRKGKEGEGMGKGRGNERKERVAIKHKNAQTNALLSLFSLGESFRFIILCTYSILVDDQPDPGIFR